MSDTAMLILFLFCLGIRWHTETERLSKWNSYKTTTFKIWGLTFFKYVRRV